MGAGGKGLNVAMSIAATGLPSYLVGRVGNDMFGHFLKRALTRGLGQPGLREDRLHGVHRRRSRAGERRTRLRHLRRTRGQRPRRRRRDTTSALDHGIRFSHLVMSFEIPLPTVVDAARRFRAAGSQVVVNFSPVSEDARQVLPHTDVLVVNEAEAAALWLQVAGRDAPMPGAGCGTPWTCFASATAAPATSW